MRNWTLLFMDAVEKNHEQAEFRTRYERACYKLYGRKNIF